MFKRGGFVLLLLAGSAALLHKPLLLLGCKALLHRSFPSVSYEKMQWEGGAIVISDLSCRDSNSALRIDKVELKMAGEWLRLCFSPQITLIHPQILLLASEKSASSGLSALFYRRGFFEPHWTVEQGVLQLASTPFYFSVQPQDFPESIGHLLLSCNPNLSVAPMLSAELSVIQNTLQVGFKLQESDLGRLKPLTALLDRGWDEILGEVELEGVIAFDPSFEVQQLHVQGTGRHLVVLAPGLALQCDQVEAFLSYPIEGREGFVWDKLKTAISVENANATLSHKEIGIRGLSGQLTSSPETGPDLLLSGWGFQGEDQLAFTLSGKGGVQEDATVWSEMALVSTSPRGGEARSLLSLCSQEEGDVALHMKVENADFEHIDFLRACAGLPGKCVEGVGSIAATLFFHHKELQRASVEQCLCEEVRWYFPEHQITAYAGQIAGDCSFQQSFTLENVHLKLEGGDYLNPAVHLQDLSSTFSYEEGVLQPSEFKGQWGELSARVSLLGPKADHFADVHVSGNTRELFALLHLDQQPALPLHFQGVVKREGELLHLDADALLAGEEIQGSASFKVVAEPHYAVHFQKGQLQADQLTEKSYTPFLPLLSSDLSMQGAITCQALIAPERMHVRIGGEKVHLSHASVALTLPQLTERPAQFFYDFQKQQGSGELPLVGATLSDLRQNLEVGNIGGSVKIETYPDKTYSAKGTFHGIFLPVNEVTFITQGRCDLLFDSKTCYLSIEKGEGIWELRDGTPLTLQLKKFSAHLSDAPCVNFALRVVDGKREFAHVEAEARRSTLASGWEVAFTPQSTHLGGVPLNISRCTLSDQMQLSSFAMKPSFKCQDVYPLASLLQNAGFLSVNPLNKEWPLLEGVVQTQLFSEDARKGFFVYADSSDLKFKAKPLGTVQLRAQKIEEKWVVEKLLLGTLSLKGAVLMDKETLTCPQFEGVWEGVAMKGSGFLKTEEKRFACTFESVRGDLSKLPFLPKIASPRTPKGTFAAALALAGNFSDPHASLQVKGETHLSIALQSPLPLLVNSTKSIPFSYTSEQGASCDKIDFQVKHAATGAYLATFGASALKVLPQEARFSAGQIEFSVTSELVRRAFEAKILPSTLSKLTWEGNLSGSGALEHSENATLLQAVLKPGLYGYDGKMLPFEQLHARYEKNIFSLRAKTLIEEQPLWAALQVDLSKEPYGALKLFDHPKAEGLTLLFRSQADTLVLDSAQGSCYGLGCNLTKSAKRKIPQASLLSGEVTVDGNAFKALLPKEVREGLQTLKLGQGYKWQGDLTLFADRRGYLASGTLSGREFEALGYRFQSLESTLEASSEQILLSHLTIEDPSGTIGIKKIALHKTEGWDLSIPEVRVVRLCPSLMRKIDAEIAPVKPFLIKNFVLSDIRCKLGDKSTLEGSGHLVFVNQFKKESSLFDAPLEMIKKMGLDPGLLTPVQGELQMQLRGDKFYLVSLDNAFSEGDRSEFYLVPTRDLSYIDLDGKIHIDLKMRQDVVLKITEPFTLTIRGTLDKPRYGLQY